MPVSVWYTSQVSCAVNVAKGSVALTGFSAHGLIQSFGNCADTRQMGVDGYAVVLCVTHPPAVLQIYILAQTP